MRYFLVILFFLQYLVSTGRNDLLKIRGMYYRASSNKLSCDSLCNFLQSRPDMKGSLLTGYLGMSCMLKASHSWNPYDKLSYFNKGKNYLNDAIEKDPENIELRFLRFCAQTNAPSFLSYNDKISADKTIILAGFGDVSDKDLRIRIRNYVVNSDVFTEKEKTLFK